MSWDEYVASRARRENYDPTRNVIRWKENVKIGDFVWTKTHDKRFWLARITGKWCYNSSPEAIEADMVNQRPAVIMEIGGRDDVPERVAKGGRHALEQIHTPEQWGRWTCLLDD